jgi:hypothetical protein
MTLNIKEIEKKSAQKDLGRLEDGPVLARIVSVIDLGNQDQTDYQTGDATPPKDKIMITFETPTEMITYTKDGEEVCKPRWISKEYTLSMHKKAGLFALTQAIAPDIEGLDELLNIPCQVTVGSTSGNKAKVIGVSKPMKGLDVPELQNDTFHFDFQEPDMKLFAGLPEWIQTKIKEANDYNGFADPDKEF